MQVTLRLRQARLWGNSPRPLRLLWLAAKQYPAGMLGAVVVVCTIGMAVLAPVLATHDPIAISMAERMQPPSAAHLLGTDQLGRDVFSRIMWGARMSILVGVAAVLVAAAAGVVIGLVAGYAGRSVELLSMRTVDVLLAYPTILLAILIVAFFGSSLTNVIIAIAIAQLPSFARLAHASTLTVKEREFVDAARVIGVPSVLICLRHILPNISAPLIVLATLDLARAILLEASLGYLGLGIQPPDPTWGSIIKDGRGALIQAPWIANSAGLMIFVLIMGINLMGDSVRDFLDPRTATARRGNTAAGPSSV